MTIFYWFLLRPIAGHCGASESHLFCPLQMRDHTDWLKKNRGVVIEPEIWKDLAEGQSTEAIPYGGGHEVVITRKIQVKREVTILRTGTTVGGEERATQVEVYCGACGDQFYANGGDEGFSDADIRALAANEQGLCRC